jgi:hypothetical protein
MTIIAHFKYVADPYVDDYFRMGWMMAHNPILYDPPGGGPHNVWIMWWPCSCPLPLLRKAKSK